MGNLKRCFAAFLIVEMLLTANGMSVFGIDLEDGSGTNLAANINQVYFAHMDTATLMKME